MSEPAAIILSPEQRRQIEAEGSTAYPNECCGILYGRDTVDNGVASAAWWNSWSRSTTASKRESSITASPSAPQTLMRAEKQCTNGQLVVGFYHSHPDHPAQPSEYDRVHGWPFYSYIIVAIHQRQPVDMTCWVLDEATEQFESQPIA